MAHLFEEEIAFTFDMKNRQKVLKRVRERPGIVFRGLSRHCSLLKRQRDPVIETLKAEDLIELREKGYWPVELSEAVSKTGTDNNRATITRVK